MSTYFVTIEVEVNDESELLAAAAAQAKSEGYTAQDYGLSIDGVVNVPACLRVLADPGESWPGTQILDSTCE